VTTGVATARGSARKGARRDQHRVPAKWRKLLALIPGYDCCATAGPGDWFDAEAADNAVEFFEECLHHIEGALAGKPFLLESWEKAIVGAIFGWKRSSGYRRYREVLLYVARKNGKTPIAAGLALCSLVTDGEIGAQNVCAAADVDQASLLFRHAAGMVDLEPELSSRLEVFRGIGQRAIHYPLENSGLKVISSEAATKHGGNGHLAIIDELHAQKDRDLVDVLSTSMASANRMQPLLIYVTTADFDREGSICNEKYEYACKIRDRVRDDHAFLPIIYEADRTENWKSKRVWAKANPNLGVSVSLEYLERECRKAQDIPALENTFKRLHLNMRTEQDVRWMSIDKWDESSGLLPGEMPEVWRARLMAELRGQECWVGMDLSKKIDLTALSLVFDATQHRPAIVLPWFWMPGENVRAFEDRDKVSYSAWHRQGFIEFSQGNEVDQQAIRKKLRELRGIFRILEIGYDDWNAMEIARQLREEDGFKMTIVKQQLRDMSEPMKQLQAMILSRRLFHGGNPILRWNTSCTTVFEDVNENIRPNKKKSSGRIDGVVATITAIARWLERSERVSVYAKGVGV